MATTTAAAPVTDASSIPAVAAILKLIVPLYSAAAKEEQAASIDALYIPNAVFDNNLVRTTRCQAFNVFEFHVLGTDNIKALFKDALKKHTPTKVTVLSSAIEAVIDQEVLAVTPGAQKVTLVMSQECQGKKKAHTKTIESTLTVDAQGKITKHYDAWVGEGDTFYLLKRGLGWAVTTFFSRP